MNPVEKYMDLRDKMDREVHSSKQVHNQRKQAIDKLNGIIQREKQNQASGGGKDKSIGQQPKADTEQAANVPVAIRHLVYGKETNEIYKLLGLSRYQFLKTMERMSYMKKHDYNCERQETLLKNVQFSRDFFKVMDHDGSGVTVDQLSWVLVSLGLAVDRNFVMKIVRLLAPGKFETGVYDGTNLTSKEFSQLFKTDPPNEKATKIIRKELIEEAEAMKLKK